MIPISKETDTRICVMFRADQREEVRRLLAEECGDNLPCVESDYFQLAERIRFAVLKMSGGRIDQVLYWIDDAKDDWRNTLHSARFANSVTDHLRWYPVAIEDKSTTT